MISTRGSVLATEGSHSAPPCRSSTSNGDNTTITVDSWTCVDASVAVKWLLDEPDRDRALRLRADVQHSGGALVVVPRFGSEVSSLIYKHFQQGHLSLSDALGLVEEGENLPVETMSPPGLPGRALEIADQFGLKWIYDAFYIALAEIVGCVLWTADEALHAAVSGAHTNVRLLSEYPLARTSA